MNRFRGATSIAVLLIAVFTLGGRVLAGGGNATGPKSGGGVTPLPSVNIPATSVDIRGGALSPANLPNISAPALPPVVVGGRTVDALPEWQNAPRAQLSAPQNPNGANAGNSGSDSGHTSALPATRNSADIQATPADNQLEAPKEPENGPQAAAEGRTTAAHDDGGDQSPDAAVERQKAFGGATFDGSAKKRSGVTERLAVIGRALGARLVGSKYVHHLLPHGLVDTVAQASGVPTPPDPPARTDDFGGPNYEPLAKIQWSASAAGVKSVFAFFKQRLAFGFKLGMTLLGISSLLQITLLPILHFSAWQLHLPAGLLHGLGRVELMTRLGPAAIVNGLTHHPLSFFFFNMPLSALVEEITFRGIKFGIVFALMASIRPIARFIASKTDGVPDLFGWPGMIKAAALRLQGLSRYAFPTAALWSAQKFAFAHFAAWGANPFLFAAHLTLGLGLAYAAYKSRSLLASAVAHFTVNVLPLLGLFAAIVLGSAALAQIYALALSVGSIAWLFYRWRKGRKDRLMTGGGMFMTLLLAAGVGLAGLQASRPAAENASAGQLAAKIWSAQSTTPPGASKQAPAPQTAPPDKTGKEAAAVDSKAGAGAFALEQPRLVALTAKAKPAVAKVVFETASMSGSGSGFIVRKEGLLVTNAHVVSAVGVHGTVTVQFADDTEVEGTVAAMNTDRDIALVQLPPRKGGWPTLAIGDASKLAEGQEVLALGHPLGLPFSVSYGIISGLGGGRGGIYVQELQTDAAINHGNSGGPLINMSGEVIGINSSIAAPTAESGSIGIGFSITSEFINAALAQFDATGNINSSYLGIIIDRSNPAASPLGVSVEQVRPGSPAALAGIKPGDQILGVNETTFRPHAGLGSLARALAQTKPKDKLVLGVLRDGQPLSITVTLGDK